MKKLVSLSITLVFLFVSNSYADIVFDFNNGTVLDGAGIATMSATDMAAPFDTVVLSSLDIRAPEFDSNGMLTGIILSAAAGDNVVTSTTSGNNALGVNNPSIGNTAYGAAGGATGAGDESQNFNVDEEWVIEFDTDVIVTEFNFSSIDATDSFVVTVQGIATPFVFSNGSSGDDFANPFGTTVIAAGTDITFSVNGTFDDTDQRIAEISVIVPSVPEPSSALALMALSGLLVCRRRRN